MTIKLNKQSIFKAIWVFYSFFFYMFWASSLKLTMNATPIKSFGYYCTAVFLIVLIISQSYRRNELIALLLVAFVVLFRFFQGDSTPLLIMLFAVAARIIGFREFVRFDIYVKFFWLITILILFVVGTLPNVEGYYGTVEYGNYKYSLGFQHPNTFAFLSITILVEGIYYLIEEIRFYHLLPILGLFGMVLFISHSRTSAYSFVFFLIVAYLLNRFGVVRMPKFLKGLVVSFPALLFLLSFGLTIAYQRGLSLAFQFDRLLSHRIRLQTQYYKQYGITLFGTNTPGDGSKVVIDNSYMKCLIIYGLLFSIVLCTVYILLLAASIRNNDNEMIALILFFLFAGFAETTVFMAGFNVTLLALFNASIFQYPKRDRSSEKELSVVKDE